MAIQTRTQRAELDASSPEAPSRSSKVRTRRNPDPGPARAAGPLPNRWYLRCKTAGDFLAAVVLLALTAPVMLLAAVLVRLTSRGPAFYTQTRLGRDGRLFTIYKVRTMIDNCESLTGPRWSMPGDPRITPLGWFLRRSHLDELPQLLNVLCGEMSLIGPRPERPEFLPELERALPCYRDRLAIRPGVTGLAQVQLPADTDLDSVRRKLALDLYYLQHVNLWLDVRILLCTACYALGVPFRMTRRVLGLPDADTAATAVPLPATEEKEEHRYRKTA